MYQVFNTMFKVDSCVILLSVNEIQESIHHITAFNSIEIPVIPGFGTLLSFIGIHHDVIFYWVYIIMLFLLIRDIND